MFANVYDISSFLQYLTEENTEYIMYNNNFYDEFYTDYDIVLKYKVI